MINNSFFRFSPLRWSRRFIIVLLAHIAIAFSATLACGYDPVTLQLAWNHQFQFAGYYAAVEYGYYREAGVDVTLREGGKGRFVRKALQTGEAQYGIAGTELLLHRKNGDPFVVLAPIFQHSPSILLTRADSGIHHPQDLIGKKVTLRPGNADVLSMFLSEGISIDKIIRIENAYNLQDLIDGRIDAFNAYVTNEPWYLEQQGIQPGIIRPVSYGVDFYSDCLFTTESEIRDHPGRVAAVLSATLRGWETAMKDPEPIIDLILHRYAAEKTREHLRYEAAAIRKFILPDLIQIGHLNSFRWQRIADIFAELGELPPDYDLDSFLYQPASDTAIRHLKIALGSTLLALITAIALSLLAGLVIRKLRKEIRECQAAELALIESESRFKELIQNIPNIAVQGYDMSRRVVFWNKASEHLYGYTSTEAMGRYIEDLIIPEFMRDQVRTDIYNWFHNNITIPSSELELQHKDTHKVPVYSSHVMQQNAKGNRTLFCLDVDLSLIRETQLRYQSLFQHMISGVAVYEAIDNGADFIIRDFNTAGERISEISREEVIGRRVTEAFPGIREFGLFDVLVSVWKTGKSKMHPVSFYQDNRISGWKENTVYKLPSGEVVAVFQDVTRQKEIEENNAIMAQKLHRARKMEAIGLMAGGVAHDLNNILSGIIGYPDLMLTQIAPGSELEKMTQAVKNSGERAAQVVADLLTLARGVATTTEVANLNHLIEDYLASPECFKKRCLYPGIQIQTYFHPDLLNVRCSTLHIRKSLMNLVTNSLEAFDGMEAGDIQIETRNIYIDAPLAGNQFMESGEYVAVVIQDTGKGISEADLERIFEPFYTRKVMGRSGTGLGLTLVWNTMRNHGGAVTVSSDTDGTRFELYLPATRDPLPGLPASRDVCAVQGKGQQILVVDDEAQQRDIASRMLIQMGYRVETVDSGEAAVEWLASRSVDLLILDMVMNPGMDGIATYRTILETHPGQKAVIASGYSKDQAVADARKAGVGAFLKKPYTLTLLGETVKSVLDASSASDLD
ncbi:MAG: hypothetical protein CSA22_02975 [Deltaproteobacteria bacterium]|nr:MAG: hypothetical protein CSA22_02975 [Deltaproteobacteria bacterium]